jgi:HD-GYP domain-containing protein (c-di-GMP phosphodiesterase class II)
MGVGLAQELGYSDHVELREFGEGLLLHDVGKSRIPESILTKRGPLDGDEWRLMREHPAMGVQIVEDNPTIPEGAKEVIRHHHEKLDGSGYPDALRHESIHPYARIAAVIDIFDALTTRRSYKGALESFPALHLMRDEMSDKLDPEVFRALVLMLKS